MDGWVLGGMLTQLRTNPNMREELKKLGYVDRQIPGWVTTGEAEADKQEAAKADPVKQTTQPTQTSTLPLPRTLPIPLYML